MFYIEVKAHNGLKLTENCKNLSYLEKKCKKTHSFGYFLLILIFFNCHHFETMKQERVPKTGFGKRNQGSNWNNCIVFQNLLSKKVYSKNNEM